MMRTVVPLLSRFLKPRFLSAGRGTSSLASRTSSAVQHDDTNQRLVTSWQGALVCSRNFNSRKRTFAGVWRAWRLSSVDDLKQEGEAQRNCLRHAGHVAYYHERTKGLIWSLRFTPSADEKLPSWAHLYARITVQLMHSDGWPDSRLPAGSLFVIQALAKGNRPILHSCPELISSWSAASCVSMTICVNSYDDEDEEADQEWLEREQRHEDAERVVDGG